MPIQQFKQTGSTPVHTSQYHQSLANAIEADPTNLGVVYSRALEIGSSRHNAFEAFTSAVDARSVAGGGVRSIFAKKTDLAAGGGSKVRFNVMGPPGGPGAVGSQSLVDRTSAIQLATYDATVAFHRDAISFSKDVFEFLSAGRILESTAIDQLSKKMGIMKQNHMMMRLIKSAVAANTYRPNNAGTTAAMTKNDFWSLDHSLAARARLSVLGGKPLSQRVGPNGSPIKGYLQFLSDMAMLPIRQQTEFMNSQSTGKIADAVSTGELYDWQGMNWYEYPSVDEKWDDYIGSPMLPKAKVSVTADKNAPNLVVNANNLQSQYFQFFPGLPYFFDDASPTGTNAEYYAWFVNPLGTVGFIAYNPSGLNTANKITATKFLSGETAGLNSRIVGNLNTGATSSVLGNVITLAGVSLNLPTTFAYTDQILPNAVIIPANINGVPIGYGFVFGAMAACFANGRIDKAMIEQTEDFGFIKKRGFETIFGTCVTTDPYGVPAGYLLVESAVKHEGYPVPEKV